MTAAVSPDGANGRGRLEVKLGGGEVWPLPEEDDALPSMRYRTRDIERMRAAVRDNARRIGSPGPASVDPPAPDRRLESDLLVPA